MSDHKDIAEMAPVRHGKWTSFIDVPCGFYATCSVCGKEHLFSVYDKQFRFCPFCGAMMDEGQERRCENVQYLHG